MKILLSLDGSDFSKAAIDFCRNIVADPKNTSLKIISTVGRPMPIDVEPAAFSAEYYTEMERSLCKQGQKIIEQAETEVRSLFPGGLLDLTAEVITGLPQWVIVETAREWGADLIVVGSHGYGFWSRALLGSVSNSVMHHAPCSVLVVRTHKEDKGINNQ